jgi:hypothetical protein
MITLRVWFLMVSIALAVIGVGLWSAVRPAAASPITLPNTSILEMLEQSDTGSDEPRIDVYGNEIQEAVGDYRIDLRGEVYESHSPDTEVIRLSAPTI